MLRAGAKSGRRLTIPLMYVPYQQGVLLVASQGGAPRNPVWYGNLVKHPDIEVNYRGRVMKLRARLAAPEEKPALWPLCDEHYAALEEPPPAADAPAREFREKTGYHCAEWLVEHCRQHGLALPAAVHVHTLNTAGGARIEALVARARADGS